MTRRLTAVETSVAVRRPLVTEDPAGPAWTLDPVVHQDLVRQLRAHVAASVAVAR